MTNDVLQKVKLPATALIITGALNGISGLLVILSSILRLVGALPSRVPSDEAARMGYYLYVVSAPIIGLLSLLIAPVIIYGAMQMMKGKKYGLARLSAVLAIIPLTSCCFIIGIPFGIWALVVLSSPAVKALFKGEIR